jgi:FtsP/CotA-like multicopper oxidase with cupredoxin domain
MPKSKSSAIARLVAMGIAISCAGTAGADPQGQYPQGPVPSPRDDGSIMKPMRRMRHEQRLDAALRALQRRKANEAAGIQAPRRRAPAQKPAGGTSLNGVSGAGAALLRLALAQPFTSPDIYAVGNYANSKLPVAHCSVATAVTCQKDADCPGYAPPFLVGINQFPGGETCAGPAVPGTGIQKFVDTLPGLCPLGANNLGNCIPLASPDTTSFPGSDYYELGMQDYVHRWHTDLPAGARTRGYYQKNPNPTFALFDPSAGANHYLGPLILAFSNRPVRVKFVNEVGTALNLKGPAGAGVAGPGQDGSLFVPVDTHLSGTGLGPLGPPGGSYSENRATIHLHGGNTPWISDGTQHQWTAPAGEPSPYKKGLSVAYVPDMWFDAAGALVPACAALQSCAVPGASNDPGEGALTFYFTNQQSGRLMFYHDHAYGITRLNVIAGEAAGYLLVNPPDEDALATAGVPGTLGTALDLAHVIPLVIQDRTFVPPATVPALATAGGNTTGILLGQLPEQDPTWDPARWGGEDSIWFPHVYLPNQWPGSPDGTNANPVGRWDYGPWFHPAQTTLTEVDYAGQVLVRPLVAPCTSAAAVTPTNLTGATTCPTTPVPSLVPEAFLDTPVVNGTAYPTLTVQAAPYRFQILNAANERNFNLSFFVADTVTVANGRTGTEVALVDAALHTPTTPVPLCRPTDPRDPATGLPRVAGTGLPCWPVEWPTDARQGGVPAPSDAGPQWIQIGSEAGLLPHAAAIPPTPVGYEQNKRNIVIGNVSTKGLFMGPAERADVIVDFTPFAGMTLILYNDAPAPVPAGDPRQDYYTGMPDFTLNGGAPTPLPGYGPNTRTIMQVKVAGTPAVPRPAPFFDAARLAALDATLQARFVASQPTPIVPEAAYSGMYGATYVNAYQPITTWGPYTFTPVGAVAPATVNIQGKALHELFTQDYGRMNSLLAMEVPFTNWLNQTTIPFSNFDPTTEFITDNEPQMWRITHNGVDTHTIHFHLLNVQIVNRVGWDGQIRAPDVNELGWKESVRMNPLEDIFIAARPVRQTLPWAIPDKWRPLDVDRALGTASQFTGVNVRNAPIAVTNTMVNFGWEYVWHCHLLGHEEEDMLRAEVFVVAPETPSGLLATGTGPNPALDPPVALAWSDVSKSTMTWTVQRDVDPLFSAPTTFSLPALVGPGVVSFAEPAANAATPGVTTYYRVQGTKTLTSPAYTGGDLGSTTNPYVASSGWSNVIAFPGPLPAAAIAPASLAFAAQLVGTASAAQTVTLSNGGAAALAVLGVALGGANPADFALASTCGASLAAPVAPATSTSCTIGVTFGPGSAGAKAASLTVTTNDPANRTLAVALTGTGAAPALAVTAAAPFGNVLIGTSATQTVTVSNTGTADLTGLTAGITGAADFTLVTTCGAVLAPAATCAITVTFAPAVTGAKAASLAIGAAAPATPLALPLSGAGIAPGGNVSPASLAFGLQGVNTTSAAQTVTLSNTGTAPLAFTAIGTGSAEFTAATTCVSPLAPAASCAIGVTFTPAAAGARTGTLTIATSAPAPALAVALTGTASALNVSTASLAFGTQVVGTTSTAGRVTLTNDGVASIAIGPATLAGAQAADFAFTTTCGATLAPLASCRYDVRFTPAAVGARGATLSIASSDPGGTRLVALAGTGVAAGLVLSATALTFGSALNVRTPAQVVTLSNLGTASATLAGTALGGANPGQFARTTTCGATLAAGASCTIGVTFRPTSSAPNPKTATLTVAATAPAVSLVVSLSGTVLVPAMTIAPLSLAFGNQGRGTTSATRTVTVTSSGLAPLVINGISLGGANPGQFTRTHNCPIGAPGLAPAATCTVSVAFRPPAFTALGGKSATLNINVAPPPVSQGVALTGTAIP